ncbi:MAG: putative lipid II flippase FtsW [Gammaproteobacteria bacterium]
MNRRQASVIEKHSRHNREIRRYDFVLIGACLFLIMIGLLMVASSSITIADRSHGEPLYYFWRQSMSVILGLGLGYLCIKTPLAVWQHLGVYLLAGGIILLILVLIPGIGREVNGSMRWVRVGPINIQASEIMKLFILVYVAGYLVRHGEAVCTTFAGFIRPIAVVTLITGLLLLEPDYGASVVIFATVLGMLFVGGVPLTRYFAWMLAAGTVLFSLAVFSPYRLQRLTTFMDPWQDPFNSGFQLTQALIAFGRGDWFGVGLGGSVQKMFYLPEAHTDFIFAVLAEELGLFGVSLVILLFFFIVWRSFVIARVARQSGKPFASYLAYGIGLFFGIQAFINIGVNMGVLPTKGLTLPLLSYGNNSMIISCLLIALLIRVEYENHEPSQGTVSDGGPGYAR